MYEAYDARRVFNLSSKKGPAEPLGPQIRFSRCSELCTCVRNLEVSTRAVELVVAVREQRQLLWRW